MKSLLKQWLLRFLHPSKLPKKFWTVNREDDSLWLPPYNISIGEPAKKYFASMTMEDQSICLENMKSFFKAGTRKLKQYLPLGNKFLRSCKFLTPVHSLHDRFPNWVSCAARHLSCVISEEDIGSLEVEARLHQSETRKIPTSDLSSEQMVDFWTKVDNSGKYPLMMKLVKAIFVLPHGNAEIERVFSNMSDVVTKKRSNLAPHTVKALLVSRSALNAKQWTARNIPFTHSLKELCANAHASYVERLREEERIAKSLQQKKMETELMMEVQAAKSANKRIASLDEHLSSKKKEIEKKLQDQMEQRRLLQELQKKTLEDEEELNKLRAEQDSLKKKKEKESERVVENVLKRKAADLFPKKSLPEIKKNRLLPK